MKDHRHVEPVAVDETPRLITKWYCEPPAMDAPFHAVEASWFNLEGRKYMYGKLKPIRRIYSWRYKGASGS